MPHTALAAPINMLVRVLDNRGLDGRDIVRRAGFDPALLSEPGARYPERLYPALWKLVVEETGDPCIGLALIQHLHASHLHALGYAWLASDSLKDALERLCRYSHVLTERDEFVLSEEHEGYRLRSIIPPGAKPIADQDSDTFMAGVVQLARFSYGDEFSPLRVEFEHPKPDCWNLFFEFFRCPVEFGCARDILWFGKKELEEKLSTGNAELAHANDAIVKRYLARLDKSQVASRVREKLIDQLSSGHATQTSVASALSMSTRALQRRLKEEGTSYKQLLDDVRKDLAVEYLSQPHTPIKEVTFMLGFSEISNFSRAFKRWTGQAPSSFQAAQR
jgi:AraC-like DNA-binding protein